MAYCIVETNRIDRMLNRYAVIDTEVDLILQYLIAYGERI